MSTRADIIAGYTYGKPYWALISQADRDKAAKSGAAMPDGSYPITTCDGENSVDTAIHAVGLGGADHDAIRRHIIKRATTLGCKSKIPDTWNADGSLKAGAAGRAFAPYEPAPYHADPDETVECPNCHKMNDTDASYCDQCGFKLAGADDVVVEAPSGQTATRARAFAPGDASPPAEPAPPADDPSAQTPQEADAKVTAAIAQTKASIDALKSAQAADPDTDDPNDKAVAALIEQLEATLLKVSNAQSQDTAGTDADPEDPQTPAPDTEEMGVAPGNQNANPVGPAGSIDNGAICADPDCGHMASLHANTDQGNNTGPCSAPNCQCPAMQVENDPNDPEDQANDITPDTPAGNKVAAGSQRAGALATESGDQEQAAPDLPAEPAPAGTTKAPAVEGSEVMGPAFAIPVGIIEGEDTGDGRLIAPGALDWRIPPLPLMWMPTSTHDPSGMSSNDPAYLVGRIDVLERKPGENGTQVIMAQGYFLPDDQGLDAAATVEAMGRVGISADVAMDSFQDVVTEADECGCAVSGLMVCTKGTIMGFTGLPYPAFEGAYIVLGDGTDAPAPIPQENPGEPMTAAIHWMPYSKCEPCDLGVQVIVASAGPPAPPASWFENPHFTEGDGRLAELVEYPGQFACPLTVTPEGRVFGHLAPWGVCHVGYPGKCITPPRSEAGYAHFMRGSTVTAEGETIKVGKITIDTPHARNDARTSAGRAMGHYDDTGYTAALVRCGEDEYGIWIAGAVTPSATAEQISKLRAHDVSGDWRHIGGNLELIGALSVPQPGFPVAVVAGGHVESLVASGAMVMHRLRNPVITEPDDMPVGDPMLRAALRPLLVQSKTNARERLAALRDNLKGI